MIKYNQVPDFIKSTEVSRKLDMKLKKGRASYHKSSLDENVIIDKLVLSPIIVRAKLLKIIKTKRKELNKNSQVITTKDYTNPSVLTLYDKINQSIVIFSVTFISLNIEIGQSSKRTYSRRRFQDYEDN